MKKARLGGPRVEIPAHVLDEFKRRKRNKGLADLAHQAGIRPGVIQQTMRLKKTRMNAHFLQRIERALAGEQLAPLHSNGKALVRLPLREEKQQITPETKALIDGVLLGVEVLRRAIYTHAGI